MSKITDGNLGEFLDGGGDAWCNKAKLGKAKFRWTERLAIPELTTRVAAEYPEVGRVRGLIARQRGGSGRIGVLAIQGDKATVEVSGDLHIRRLLGGLRSTLFEIKREGDAFVLRGAGFGHGVGMCQMGAIGMAGAGKSEKQILAHYYRGSHLHRLY
jgi:SpoIID/LytB domain protein